MKCLVCQKTFGKKKYLKQHLLTHNERKFQCSKCPKKFARKANRNHHENHHEKIHLRRPARGKGWHPLSDWIQNTKCVLNVQNKDNKCFVHAIMVSLYTPVHNRQHPYAYSKFYQENNAPTFNLLIFPNFSLTSR